MYLHTLFLLFAVLSILWADAAERINQASSLLIQSESSANCLNGCPGDEDSRGSGR